MAAGFLLMTAAASASRSAAWNSPSAWMTFARRSRSASACRAMARCISWGRSTFFTSTALTFTPDGGRLAATDENGHVGVWDLRTGKWIRHWKFPGPVLGAAFAPDGRHLALANANSTVYVLRLAGH